jgi:hypothetical protein
MGLKQRRFPAFCFFYGFLVFGILFCTSAGKADDEMNSLNAFYEKFPNLTLVYPSLGLSTTEGAKVLADIEAYSKFLSQWGKVNMVKDSDFTISSSPANGILIFGTENSNSVLKTFKGELLARSQAKGFSICGKRWDKEDVGAIFLNHLGERWVAVFYLPNLNFLERISSVFHGPTGFVIFNPISFSGNPNAILAEGNFLKEDKTWVIDETTYREIDPIDEMAVVKVPAKNSSLYKGDILHSIDGKEIKASNFSFLLGKLDGNKNYQGTVIRTGKTMTLKLSPTEIQESGIHFLPAEIPEIHRAEVISEFARLRTVFQESYIDPFDLLASKTFLLNFQKSPFIPPGSKINLLDFYKLLARFASALNDGHAYIDTRKARTFLDTDILLRSRRLFPFQPLISGTKLFVPENSLKIPKGSEIRKINHRPTEEVLARMAEFASGDTFPHKLSEFALEGFSDFYCFAFGEEPQFTLEMNSSGKAITLTVPGAFLFDRENQALPPEKEPITELASDVLLLRIDSFSPSQEFSKLIADTFKKLKKTGVPNLVLDLRQNGGGSTDALQELFSHLISSDYRVYQFCRVKRSRWAEKKGYVFAEDNPFGEKYLYNITSTTPGGKDVYSGRVFVIIGPMTFSTAFDCAALLKELRNAVLVGEAAGGKMVQSGNHFQIPTLNFGMTISVPYKDFLPSLKSLKDYSSTNPKLGLEPDHAVFVTGDSIRRGVDPCLEFVKDFLRKEGEFKTLHHER